MKNDYVIAKYIRLSIDDAQSDSLSVENQRLILDKRISEMEIANTTVLEFIDNGHSGMNFERPAVQELLELVRQGSVNCIIVKDISRFGRSMIDTGYYIERVLPLYRVRFISISDYFDSADHEGSTGGTEIALKFLIHEFYSKDLSKKIKTAKRAKAQRGEFVSKNCVFGFKKNNNRLEIDEPAAETVRLIFDMANSGHNVRSIVKCLYEEQRQTPAEYKRRKNNRKSREFSCVWNDTTIRSILADEQYIGTFVAGKTKSIEVGSGVGVPVDKSEWIMIPDHHPVIIDKKVFDSVQRLSGQKKQSTKNPKTKTCERYKNVGSPLKGMVFCGCCGRKLQSNSTRNQLFQCVFARDAKDIECSGYGILVDKLESNILNMIHEQSHNLINGYNDISLSNVGNAAQYEALRNAEKAKLDLYENYVLGKITADEYQNSKPELDSSFHHAKLLYSSTIKDTESLSINKSLLDVAEKTISAVKLTGEVVSSLVEKVIVFPNDLIEVIWLHKTAS